MSDFMEMIDPRTMTAKLLENGKVIAEYKVEQCDKCAMIVQLDSLGYQKSDPVEIAVAQYFGIKDFEPTCGTFKDQADVASFIEVKHTKWRDGHLIVKESDRNSDIAVLVVGTSPQYYIAGWIPVAVAKKPRFKHDKSNSWWVSQINLQPIETLQRSQYGAARL